jgi:hypothetical protein
MTSPDVYVHVYLLSYNHLLWSRRFHVLLISLVCIRIHAHTHTHDDVADVLYDKVRGTTYRLSNK